MPFKIARPIVQDFKLEKSDEAYGVTDEPSTITIRQATQIDHERRAQLFSQIVREMGKDDETVRMIQRFSFEELKRIEVMLTLTGSNLKNESGGPLFEFDSKGRVREVQFNEAWGLLPPLIASEIHNKVLELNVDWRPQGE